MSNQKRILRRKLIADRLAMDKAEAAEKSRLIVNTLINAVEWENIKKMHVYTSLTPINEISTVDIQNIVSQRWPNIIASTSPARRDAAFPVEQFDLIIVPVLGFDKNNNRLGMGGGWYDRFLSGQTHAKTIGLAYAAACVERLPVEAHDVPLQRIITEDDFSDLAD